MIVRLIDGTWELFRHYFAIQGAASRSPRGSAGGAGSDAAVRGAVGTVVGLLESGSTHVGVATDHVIESFRNQLWPGYKSSESIDPELVRQIPVFEDALGHLGVTVWPMVDLEADDALASATSALVDDPQVEQVVIDSPDKDLSQLVRGTSVVRLDRSRRPALLVDEKAVVDRYGVGPESLADWLALVGDSADGFPGLRGWGPASTSAVLARYGHIADIPQSASDWDVSLPSGASAPKLSATLESHREEAALFLRLATLVVDRSLGQLGAALAWNGPSAGFDQVCRQLDAPKLAARARAAWQRTAGGGPPYPAFDA
ncbi:MAG: flap endonuclease [Actinomycetota bacterium]|nr:flap endonuclease [Actinomycetota bacterium]